MSGVGGVYVFSSDESMLRFDKYFVNDYQPFLVEESKEKLIKLNKNGNSKRISSSTNA